MLRRTLALIVATLVATPLVVLAASADNRDVPAGDGDAIFAVVDDGALLPVAVRKHGTFIDPGSNDGGPPERLRTQANAALAAHGSRVHVIFGGRTVATVAAKVADGGAQITVPGSLHLGGFVTALASPTLDGYAQSPRRAPTGTERTAALGIAAAKLHTPPARLTVRNLTAIDLGRGMALAGTLNLRGTAARRTDVRVFFVLERSGGTYAPTLFNTQSITVTETMLEEPAEYLVDALDLGHATPALVTHVIGYDSGTYRIYQRASTGDWKPAYSGGGAAM
jgi:hypothetical protein